MARSRVYGVPKLRRTLRRLPDTVTAEVKREIKTAADGLLKEMSQAAPHSSIREAMRAVISRDGFTARIGLIGKRANRKGFLARIFEFGAKAHKIGLRGMRKGRAKRVLATTDGKFLGKEVQHPGMSARPFFFAPMKRKKPQLVKRFRAAVSKAIQRASLGG